LKRRRVSTTYDDQYSKLFSQESSRAATEALLERYPFWALWMGARTVYVDSRVREALRRGTKQVVLLGSGLDARALRFRGEAQFYEIDQPATLDFKKETLGGDLPSRLLPATDYLTTFSHLPSALADVGLDWSEPVIVVWEGNLPYVPRLEAQRLMTDLLAAGSRSSTTVVFDTMSSVVAREDRKIHTGDRTLDAALERLMAAYGDGSNMWIGDWRPTDLPAHAHIADSTDSMTYVQALYGDPVLDALYAKDHSLTHLLPALSREYAFHTVVVGAAN